MSGSRDPTNITIMKSPKGGRTSLSEEAFLVDKFSEISLFKLQNHSYFCQKLTRRILAR
jgi:hypothetical protein